MYMNNFNIEKDKNRYFAKTRIRRIQYEELLKSVKITTKEILNILFKLERDSYVDTKVVTGNIEIFERYSRKACEYLNIKINSIPSLKIEPSLLLFFNISVEKNGELRYKSKNFFYDEIVQIRPSKVRTRIGKNQREIKVKEEIVQDSKTKKDYKYTMSQLEELIISKKNQLEIIKSRISSLESIETSQDDDIESELKILENEISNLKREKNSLIEEITKSDDITKKILYPKYQETLDLLENKEKYYNDNIQKFSRKKTIFLSDEKAIEINKYKTIKRNIEVEISGLEEERTSRIEEKKEFISRVVIPSQYVKDDKVTVIENLTGYSKSISRYKSIYAVYYNILTRGSIVTYSDKIKELDDELKNQVYGLQILMLLLLREGKIGDDTWEFDIDKNHIGLIKLAFEETMYWVTEISKLTKYKFTTPNLKISDDPEAIKILLEEGIIEDDDTYIIKREDNVFFGYNELGIWVENRIPYEIKNIEAHKSILRKLMNYLFNFTDFREGQFEIIRNFLNGNNTIGILTTGGGKSLTYYLAVLLQPKVSLVIAPINSLIKDQTDKLRDQFGIDKTAILTSDNIDMQKDLIRFSEGQAMFTFASPERAQNIKFREILISLNYNQTIGTVVLDEVHCLSEWGHDFRIPYLMLSTTLNTYCDGIKYLGLTATASINVIRDLIVELNVKAEDIIFTKNLKRENLNFKIKNYQSSDAALNDLKTKMLKHYGTGSNLDFSKSNEVRNSLIIFTRTIRGQSGVESLQRELNKTFPNYISSYHGSKKDEQDIFMRDEKPVLVSTKAFGMGIDKPNIRLAAHFGMPESRESYYQEAGRAGRDNKEAECILYSFTPKSQQHLIQEFFDPNTSLSRLDEIKEELKGTDISTNFYFYLMDIESIETEVKKTRELYEKIRNHVNYHYIVESENNRDKTEKYLYILHKMGIINNWSVTYQGSNRKIYTIEVNSNFLDIEHIKKTSLMYIKVYSEKTDRKDLSHDKKYQKIISDVYRIEDLNVIIKAMRQWYYNTFTQTRRIQLENMYRLVNDPNENIQEILESAFNIGEILMGAKEGYSLTFEENTIEEVITFGFDLSKGRLLERKISIEHLLESTTSLKVQLYLSILVLRLNKFTNDNNGKQRFEYVLKELNYEEKEDLMYAIKNNYNKIDQKNKLELFNSLYYSDERMFKKMVDLLEQDDVVKYIRSSLMLEKLRKRW